MCNIFNFLKFVIYYFKIIQSKFECCIRYVLFIFLKPCRSIIKNGERVSLCQINTSNKFTSFVNFVYAF